MERYAKTTHPGSGELIDTLWNVNSEDTFAYPFTISN